MSPALLVAEPEPDSRGFLQRQLEHDGFRVLEAGAVDEALELAERERPGLILLGSSFPGSTELEVCERVRRGEPGRSWDRDVALILLGRAGSDAFDRVRAFARGCDDFVAEPFHYEELLARIRAVLRRTSPPPPDRIHADRITLDRATRRVTVGRTRVNLAGKEYELLLKLASDPTRVFTKDELLRDVWGFRCLGRTRTLDSHASRLRRKLGAAGEGDYVVNEWGVGYRLLDA